MTPRVSVASAVSLTTEVLGGTLSLDIHGDQLNLLPPMCAIVAGERRLSRQAPFVYSTNAPFEPSGSANTHGDTKFRAFGLLKHDADLTAAAGAIRKGAALLSSTPMTLIRCRSTGLSCLTG